LKDINRAQASGQIPDVLGLRKVMATRPGTLVWVSDLTRNNRLALLDVLEDMQNELQINQDSPSIPLMPQVIKHVELFPGDSVGMRDRYMELRYKAVQSLAQRGVIDAFELIDGGYGHRWNSRLKFSANLAKVSALMGALQSTFKRTESPTRRLTKYLSHLLSFAIGIAFTVAIMREVWWLWALVVGLAVILAASLRIIPRWSGALRTIADWATVVAACAAVVALVWTITHTPTTSP
jgi:hypothetical protein